MDNSVISMYEMTKSNIEKTIADQKARGVDSSVSEKCLEELETSYMEYEKDNGALLFQSISDLAIQESVTIKVEFDRRVGLITVYVYGKNEGYTALPNYKSNSETLDRIKEIVRRANEYEDICC